MKTKHDLMLATVAQLLEKLMGYGVIAILAHAYELADMGTYFFALAVAELVSTAVQFGTNEYLVRNVASKPEEANKDLGEVVGLRLVATVVALLMLAGFFALWRPQTLGITMLTVGYVLSRNIYYAYAAFFVGMRRIAVRVYTLITSQLLMLVAAVVGYLQDMAFTTVLGLFVLVNVLLIFFAVVMVRRGFGPAPIYFHFSKMRRLLAASFGLYAMAILSLLRFKVDTLMLGVLPMHDGTPTEVEVARYESAYKIFEASRFMVRPAILIYLPICAALYATAKWDKLTQKLHRLYGLSFVGGLVMAGVVFVIAPWIIFTVYGEQYQEAIPVLRVLFLTVPLMYVGFVGQYMANAVHLERKAVWVSLFCLTLNIVANAIVIPAHGSIGAAWTTLVTEALSMIGIGVLVYRRLNYRKRHPELDPATDNRDQAQAQPVPVSPAPMPEG